MRRPKNVYRGKRRYSGLITALLFILIALLALAIFAFYYMQRFVVYEQDRVYLDFDGAFEQTGETPPPAPAPENVDAEIVVDSSDFSSLDTGAGEGLSELRAMYVSADELNAGNLGYIGALLERSGCSAVLIQMQRADGSFTYHSSLPEADGYGLNGGEDIALALDELRQAGVWLCAEITSLADTSMAQRNVTAALCSPVGGAVSEDGQCWLDPYSGATLEYIEAIISELSGMGFDEVLLTGMNLPAGEEFAYSLPMTATPDSVTAVASFALKLREYADGLGIRLSAELDSARLRDGTLAAAGQDAELFYSLFDRVYLQSDSSLLASDLALIEAQSGVSDAARTVAWSYFSAAPDAGSFAMK